MNLKEFYLAVGGDYEDVKRRLINDTIILKVLKKFPLDDNMDKLEVFLNERNYPMAYISAHALKGISSNLGLTILEKPVAELSDALKNHTYSGLFPISLKETYQWIAKMIQAIES